MTWQEIHQFDQQLTLTINSWNSSFSDPIWAFFSDKYVWIPMYAGIIALLIWKLGWKKSIPVILAAVLTIVFCDQFSNLIKNAVQRIRPLEDAYMVSQGLNILEWGGGYSFFSAHAANTFGLAGCTYLGLSACLYDNPTSSDRKWVKGYGIWMYVWAALVAISRIFVGRHYLGDVLAGTVVGIVAGLLFGYIALWIIRKYFKN